MIEIDKFTDDQKEFLARIVDDLDRPTVVGELLQIIENLLYTLDPGWEHPAISDTDGRAELEVCMAALSYLKVKRIAAKGET